MTSALISAAERLQALAYRWSWGVPEWCCRAYLQALEVGADPVRAIGRAHFGADYALYDSDPAWLDEASRPRSRTFCCVQWAGALAKADAALRAAGEQA